MCLGMFFQIRDINPTFRKEFAYFCNESDVIRTMAKKDHVRKVLRGVLTGDCQRDVGKLGWSSTSTAPMCSIHLRYAIANSVAAVPKQYQKRLKRLLWVWCGRARLCRRVLAATVRALKMHSGVARDCLARENLEALMVEARNSLSSFAATS